MALFDYKGLDKEGRLQRGEVDAVDRRQAVVKLAAEGIKAVALNPRDQEAVDGAANLDLFSRGKDSGRTADPGGFPAKKAKASHALGFLKKLHVLLAAGLPLGDAVRLLGARVTDPALKSLSHEIWKKLSEGRTLASSLRDYPQVFNESLSYLVEAGEASGNLVPILERIVAYLEEADEMKRKLVAGLAYPAFIVTLALGVVAFFLLFLLPRIRLMLETLGGEMQWLARVLIGGSDMLMRFGPLALGAVVLVYLAVRQWRRTESGRQSTDLFFLRLPAIGQILLYSVIFQSTNLLATLLSSGINTSEALRLVERTILNRPLRAKFAAARRQIQEGVSMATAIQRVHFMPDMAMDILTVGENTGNISRSLRDINRIYQRELGDKLTFLTRLISSVALFAAFTLVAVIALSIVLSVFQVSSALSTR